jgi:hypothetical protein
MKIIIRERPYGIRGIAWINHENIVCRVTADRINYVMSYDGWRWRETSLPLPYHRIIRQRVNKICGLGQSLVVDIKYIENLTQ